MKLDAVSLALRSSRRCLLLLAVLSHFLDVPSPSSFGSLPFSYLRPAMFFFSHLGNTHSMTLHWASPVDLDNAH